MFITINNMHCRARYIEQLRDCFDPNECAITSDGSDNQGDQTIRVELSNARIDTIGSHLMVISSLSHTQRPGLFLSRNDFSIIEIC